MVNENKKCAHENCSCMAEPGSKYCSLYCEDSKAFHTLSCGCGHEACKSQSI
jgi:hypothetical protein